MMTESRRDFEALARNKGWNLTTIMLTSNPPQFGRYADGGTQAAFEAWESGRMLLGLQMRRLTLAADTVTACYARRPENFPQALENLDAEAERARELLAEVKA